MHPSKGDFIRWSDTLGSSWSRSWMSSASNKPPYLVNPGGYSISSSAATISSASEPFSQRPALIETLDT